MRALELTGRRFTRLVAQERVAKKWRCLCDCGNEVFVVPANLTSGNTRSCGCLQKDTMRDMPRSAGARARDLNGFRSGRLVARQYLGSDGGGASWLCECDCGRTSTHRASSLFSGDAKSCGCLCPGTSTRSTRQQDLTIDGEETPNRAECFERDGGVCHLCGSVVEGVWHMDHVIPLTEFGPHCQDNVAVSHPSCNVKKYVAISWDSPAFPRAAAAYVRLHGVEISRDAAKRRHDIGLGSRA